MKLVIWNKTDADNIDVFIADDYIKVLINDIQHWTKKIETREDLGFYEELLGDIEKINQMYIDKDEENFQKLSEDFLNKLEVS